MASRPIRCKTKQALDRRAASMFGPGATGLQYVTHWVGDRRSMVGLARAVGADFGRPTLSRECLWSAIRLYDGYAEQIATARQQVAHRQTEYEQAAGLAEAPPAPKESLFRAAVVPHTGPLTLDHLRCTRYTGSTSAPASGR